MERLNPRPCIAPQGMHHLARRRSYDPSRVQRSFPLWMNKRLLVLHAPGDKALKIRDGRVIFQRETAPERNVSFAR
jgi:hypothetical protein